MAPNTDRQSRLIKWLTQIANFLRNVNQGIAFLLMEFQSKWIARVLSGKLLLPSEEEMLADVQQHYLHMEESQIPKRHTHLLNPFEVNSHHSFYLSSFQILA
ncbi:hypothetical protein HYC85_010845 [Camellia sinensis]|uniref:Uncharacterized protein n=1 Tax=Camellia sinensis TaxID=4442 RepID=A0A7J7HKZ4_CAMSI|nr:hypothetical protein HYC85_010845 [Camellia sinensis]